MNRNILILCVAALMIAGLIVIALAFEPPSAPEFKVQFQYVDTTPSFIHNYGRG